MCSTRIRATYAFPDSEPVTSTNKEAHFWDWNHDRAARTGTAICWPRHSQKRLSMDFTPEYAHDDRCADRGLQAA
jgi:hypothetical protein